MAFDLKKIRALAEQAAENGPDYNNQSGGGDYIPPAAGTTRLRFIEYVELGVHTTNSKQYGPKTKPRAQFGFELSGPKHPPKEIDGKLYPYVIRFEEPIGSGAKNNYSKLFKIMVADFPGAKNFGQLLGNAYLGEVFHREYESGGAKRIAAELKSRDKGIGIKSTLYEDPKTGELQRIKVDMPLSGYRYLEWANATVDMWDSIFIDGTFDDGKTKNKVQEKVKAAENFVGSPVYNALIEEGREAELERAEEVELPASSDDEPDDATTGDPDNAPASVQAERPKEVAPQKAPAKASKPAQEAPKSEAKGKVAAQQKTAPKAAKAVAKSAPANKPAKSVPPADDNDPLQGL